MKYREIAMQICIDAHDRKLRREKRKEMSSSTAKERLGLLSWARGIIWSLTVIFLIGEVICWPGENAGGFNRTIDWSPALIITILVTFFVGRRFAKKLHPTQGLVQVATWKDQLIAVGLIDTLTSLVQTATYDRKTPDLTIEGAMLREAFGYLVKEAGKKTSEYGGNTTAKGREWMQHQFHLMTLQGLLSVDLKGAQSSGDFTDGSVIFMTGGHQAIPAAS